MEPAGFIIHQSNRTEALLAALAEVLARPPADPLQPEVIVVRSLGMRTWLAQQLARRLGVWSLAWFPFPRDLVDHLIEGLLPECSERRCYAPEALYWAVRDDLPALLDEPAFAALRRYLSGPARERKAHQLAGRVARLFDGYFLYRPQMILAWEAGEGDHWQARLFRSLRLRLGPHHPARVLDELRRALQRSAAAAELPPRLSVFGLSSLPPIYLQLLAGLARRRAVHLYLLNPSQAYWSHIRSQRSIVRAAERAGRSPEALAAELHLEPGHPLLAAWGQQGRELQLVIEREIDYDDSDDRFVDPLAAAGECLLTRLQSDILHLRQRPGPEAPAVELAPEDDSLEIHACHSPMREVETLADRLRLLFEAEPDLQPHQVLVMSPDIEAYAPLLEAVFGGRDPIPFSISDRRQRAESGVVRAMLTILEGVDGRLTASWVLDLLAQTAVRERFGLDERDVEQLGAWAREAGVRWGMDAAHRVRLGQPDFDQSSWRFGLDRLLLGCAMPADGRTLFGGRLAAPQAEGREAELLGRLAAFCDLLFGELRALTRPRPVTEWAERLERCAERLLAAGGEHHPQHQLLRHALAELADAAEAAGHAVPVAFESIRLALADRLDERVTHAGFLSGGVTCCNLQPMRSLPFAVVCLLGMNDGAFPRTERRPAFDLLAQSPRPGDPSRRNEDRTLFLEALLAARRHLIVTYTGRDARDDRPLPPSVLVADLLDAAGQACGLDTEAAARELVCQQPLQPYSPRLFDTADTRRLRPRGTAAVWCAAAEAAAGTRRPAPPFMSSRLPAGPERDSAVQLEDLIRFLRDPPAWLLSRRLGLRIEPVPQAEVERELLEAEGLAGYQAAERLLAALLEPEPANDEELVARLQADNALPPGAGGQAWLHKLRRRVAPIAVAARRWTGAPPLPPVSFELPLAGGRLVGTLEGLRPEGRIVVTSGVVGARRRLDAWVHHLALVCAAPAGVAPISRLLGRASNGTAPTARRWADVSAPAAELERLLALYRRGCCEPLAFFPKSALVLAEKLQGADAADSAARSSAVAAARRELFSDWGGFAEARTPAVRQVFGERDPLADEGTFIALALAVWSPELEAGQQEEPR
jgi:exodeoxyribonuclease V gamma subunit